MACGPRYLATIHSFSRPGSDALEKKQSREGGLEHKTHLLRAYQAPLGYNTVQERVKGAGLGCSTPAHSQERPVSSACLPRSPWPASGSWGLSSWNTTPDKRVFICLGPHGTSVIRWFTPTVWFLVNTCFCSRELESVTWVLCLYDWLPIKTLDPKSWVSFPVDDTERVLSHAGTGRIKHVPATSRAEDTQQLMLDFPGLGPVCSFPLLILLCVLFPVINHNCENTSFSDSCGSFWWITEPEGGLGDPQHEHQQPNLNILAPWAHLWFRDSYFNQRSLRQRIF